MKKSDLHNEVKKMRSLLESSCRFIWERPEEGGNEKESADYFRKILGDEGFKIVNEEHLEHAFYAEDGSGKLLRYIAFVFYFNRNIPCLDSAWKVS